MKEIEDLLAIGESTLRLVTKHVKEAEVFITRSSSRSMKIENDAIKAVSGGGEMGIAIRILKNGRLGFSYATDLNSIPCAIEFALQGAAISPVKPFIFPAHETYHTVPELLDKRVLDLSLDMTLELATCMIDAAKDVHDDINVSGGGISYGEEEVVIMNTMGLEVSEHLSGISASIYAICEGENPSSGYEYDSSHLLIHDVDEIGRKAADLALRGQNKIKIETGKMPVVFKPDSISSFLEFILISSLYGIRAERGESVYSGMKGEMIIDEDLSVVDDPTMPDAENAMKMDDEGVPSRCHEIIKAGELKDYLYTIGTGAEYDHPSTSNGMRGGGQDHTSPVSTTGRNIMIQGNTRNEETLISEIDRGLLVHDIMGAHTANPISGDFSVTGSILFLIEKGEVTRPISQAMLSGNFPEHLKRVSGIGNNYRRLSGGLSPIGFYIPSVRVDDVQVTGEL